MKSLLFIMVTLAAVASTLSGLLLAIDPTGGILNLTPGYLEGTPFEDYRLPGILLMIVVGMVNLLAVFFNLQRHPWRYNWALAGGLLLCIWIIGQMIMIQSYHWLYLLFLGLGLMILLTAYQLKGKWVV